ncbi:MAG: hypothetical protein JOY66_14775 [Acetobacteraceae bacterium]|nr:hypothetical protein [Acetobacteraceae bacterium]
MQPRTGILPTFTLGAAVFLSTAATAADLPKEGTFSGQYSAVGTVKANPLGKERVLLIYDNNGLSVGEGIFNHFTWHCWGLGDYANGQGQDHGYCVATDPTGDQVAVDWKDESHPGDQKIVGSFTLTSGTGKYAGITGPATFTIEGADFRSPVEGTSFIHNTYKGSYKLP